MKNEFFAAFLVGKKRFYNLFWGAKVTVQMRVLSAPTFFSIKKGSLSNVGVPHN
ncbi:hypothetical protein Acin_0951 [Acidaminococcus intestini RyC-MR95]|uniref:Uncharacterized protein n=1 Tax=Acidaminococcus intestini (strain RyC-MR95) TaxID=568816 RepID=G4Q679_ACIIR|nr:hypothetical protein Acin_0951 [Acidaminococcus intestini RyC-MR95]